MSQLDIFDQPKAKLTDPQTSHDAAERVKKTRAGSQRQKLWAAFVSAYPTGLTDLEAARIAWVPLTSEYATRCSELRRAGVIEVTGETRPGEYDNERDVSVLTEYGRALYFEIFG